VEDRPLIMLTWGDQHGCQPRERAERCFPSWPLSV